MVFDAQTFEEWDEEFTGGNPCHFKGYEEKLGDLQRDTGLNEAVITGKGKIDGMEAAVGVCDTRFLMGSMGYVVGEKLTRAIERATGRKASADNIYLFRGRENAGGHCITHANGKDGGGAEKI